MATTRLPLDLTADLMGEFDVLEQALRNQAIAEDPTAALMAAEYRNLYQLPHLPTGAHDGSDTSTACGFGN